MRTVASKKLISLFLSQGNKQKPKTLAAITAEKFFVDHDLILSKEQILQMQSTSKHMSEIAKESV